MSDIIGYKCYLLLILLDTRASKSFMPRSQYLCCKLCHSLPKFASRTQRIQVGNGKFISVLFIIPIIVDIHEHRFQIYTLLSDIHEDIHLDLGNKNIFELECVISSQDCCLNFSNRSQPIFLKEYIVLKPKDQKLIKVEAPFIDEISRLAIIKVLDKNTQNTMMLKLKLYEIQIH